VVAINNNMPENSDRLIKGLIFLLFLALLWLITSCSHTKDLTKTKTDEKTDIKTETVATRTITETSKESVKIDADSLTSDITISSLLNGDSLEAEDDNITLKIKVVNKKVVVKAKVKEKIVPVNIEKKTVEVISEKKHEVKKTEVSTKDVHKEVTGGLNLNYLWWLLLLLLIPLYKYRKTLL